MNKRPTNAGKTPRKEQLDNQANQLNPNNERFGKEREPNRAAKTPQEKQLDNRANQLNPNNERFQKARRPKNP